jgi:hypothetical protein
MLGVTHSGFVNKLNKTQELRAYRGGGNSWPSCGALRRLPRNEREGETCFIKRFAAICSVARTREVVEFNEAEAIKP